MTDFREEDLHPHEQTSKLPILNRVKDRGKISSLGLILYNFNVRLQSVFNLRAHRIFNILSFVGNDVSFHPS